MTMIRKVVAAQVNALGEDEVEVIMSTAALARDGHILIPQGCNLDPYRANPIVLWQHDPDHPVGNAENIQIDGDKIVAKIRFAPIGTTQKSDEVRGLVKSGVVRAVSVGFEPLEAEPLDPKKPRGGQRITEWELLECSFVSVPADTGAIVTARAKGDGNMADWKVGASRDFKIEDSDDWDGSAAAKSIFEHAGGDKFDPKIARKGFLVYDADAPEKRGSYKLPIAHVVGEELKVPKGAIRAAASRLPDTDIPDDVKKGAQAVIDHYKKEAGIGDEGDRSRHAPATRAAARKGKIILARGLYDVANICYLFENLGWQVDVAKWEAALEGDESKVPAMLFAVLQDLGEVIIAMTQEEIEEALAGRDMEPEEDADDVVLVEEERARIRNAKTPALRAFRRGLARARLRGGKTLSAESVRCLREAQDLHNEARDCMRSAMRKHRDAMDKIDDMMDRAGVSDEGDKDAAKSDGAQDDNNARGRHSFAARQADLHSLSTKH